MRIVPAIRTARRLMRTAKVGIQTVTSDHSKAKHAYAWYRKHCEVDPRLILLDSFNGKGVTDSAYAILQEMMSQGITEDYTVFISSKDPKKDQPFVDAHNLPVHLVGVDTKEYAHILAAAGHILTNSAFASYFIRRPQQIVVDVWHGTPLKTLGKQMRKGMQSMFFAQHTFMQSSWLTYPNDFTRDAMMRDYNISELYTGKVAMVGYPRNTVFLRGDNESIRSTYGLDGLTTFAYMPTWRGKSTQDIDTVGYVVRAKEILDQIDAGMRDDQRMYVNFHPMVAPYVTLDSYAHIKPFPSNIGTYDFLAQLDVLITDYSSVMFDFALTKKPIILFTYDMEEYLSDRGLYFPIDDLPFPQFSTTEGVVECMKSGAYALKSGEREVFNNTFLKYDTANNAADVLSLLLHDDPGTLKTIDFSQNRSKTWTVVDSKPQRSVADINGVFLSSNPDEEIILLDRRIFGPIKSSHVVDNYIDEHKFIFVSDDNPRTRMQEVTARLLPAAKRKDVRRERQRVFGELPTAPKARTTRLTGEANTTFSDGLETTLFGSCATDGDRLVVSFDAQQYEVHRLLLVTGYTVRWSKHLSDEEKQRGVADLRVLQPVVSPLCKAKVGMKPRICLLIEDPDTHNMLVANLLVADQGRGTKRNFALGAPIVLDWDDINPLVTYDEKEKTGIPLIDNAHGSSIAILPFSNQGVISAIFAFKETVAQAYCTPMVNWIRTPGQGDLKLTIRIDSADVTVLAVEIRNRIVSSSTKRQLDYVVTERNGVTHIDATLKADAFEYDGLFWDPYVVVAMPDGERYDLACYTGDFVRHSLFFRNVQSVLPSGNVIFPYALGSTKLAFCHRVLHKSDTLATRAKEWTAVALWSIMWPWWRSRNIWLMYEKFCAHAQDNGFAFFEWCMNEAPESIRSRVYYVMDPQADEYKKVQKYGRNVVPFMSLRHMLYALAARIYVSPDSVTHLYQWRSKPSVVRRLMGRKPILFLQHGVTAFKRVDHLFGVRGTTPMTYFLTTSHAEQDVVVHNLGYMVHNAPILGFSRWDLLRNTADPSHRTILIMPTWRVWLEDVGDEAFLASEYYRSYAELIQDERLQVLLEDANVTLEFFIHPKLADKLRHFSGLSDRVKLIPMGEVPLNELLMSCSALVTDYSSVAWDVLYMDKPVVFYQFDQQQYLEEVGSYIDLNNDLPGPLCKDLEALIQALEQLLHDDCVISQEYAAKADAWFDFRDQNNRKRTYDFLKREGY